eukprot:3135491-Amphidinium_carterae.1
MVAPTFSSTFSREDVVAVLKRSNLVIFGKTYVYVRPSVVGEYPVSAFSYPGGDRDLLDDEKKVNLRLFRSGSEDWQMDPVAFKWGVDIVSELFGTAKPNTVVVPDAGFGFTRALRDALPPETEGRASQMMVPPP